VIRYSTQPARFYCNSASDRTKGWVKRAAPFGASVMVPPGTDGTFRVEA
jgi:hypothetical protein